MERLHLREAWFCVEVVGVSSAKEEAVETTAKRNVAIRNGGMLFIFRVVRSR